MKLSSWGNYPYHQQSAHPIYWRKDLPEKFTALTEKYGSLLPFGNGRSYGDSCLAASNQVITMRNLNRFIEADWNSGIIKAEAGITLEEVLEIIIPRGWFLPVTPGTKYITLGGAVANDVHGKNHHKRGTFGCHIKSFSLLRSNQNPMICSPKENNDLFCATIGGLGLTGIIEWVEFQLMPINSSLIDKKTIRFSSLDEFFNLSNELDNSHEYSVSWVDCLASGKNLGRGIFMCGNHAKKGGLNVSEKSKIAIPFTPPFSLFNKLTLKPLNWIYYNSNKNGEEYADYDSFFYPLDRILKWNRIYGTKGFQQYQCAIPSQTAKDAIKDLLNTISKKRAGSFLAILKNCGDVKSPGLLSFPMPGTSLALDFAQNDNINKNLFEQLDKIIHQAGGRIYPAKDAHMSGEDFKRFYPNWKTVESLRDPALYSHFWKRVLS